jgi:hypothetical protein
MTTKESWQGRVYEDFQVGDIYRHALGRTVTQTDNIWFTLLMRRRRHSRNPWSIRHLQSPW